jgi:hypothetical protein
VDDSYDMEVLAVLLNFGMLNKAQRSAFADQFNRFMYGSPQRQRGLMERWSILCRHSQSPTIKMIAESSATYIAREKKPRNK